MLQKAMMAAAALAAMAVAAAVGVIALAFALYALLRDLIGPAGAAACVAAVAALAIALAGLFAARGADQPEDTESFGLAEKLLELVRDKPLASAGVALAAGLLVMRNPAVIGVIVRTLLEAWQAPQPKAKGRRSRS
ncbi:hypothetical protein [Phenylobacterium montanum]|uniref:Uncharacterized protein n=1 Tax=Phenylobacterium montanum TaxID=2823693 RepID=A0A975FZ46_9CAUL|nr:hypothetical protein [Caulobacter sp. S6]QUD87639.1 hypothetical protein KCG34_21740 [Caulobacter sp. S6]